MHTAGALNVFASPCGQFAAVSQAGQPQILVYDSFGEDAEPVGTFNAVTEGADLEKLHELPLCAWQEDSAALAVSDPAGNLLLLSRWPLLSFADSL